MNKVINGDCKDVLKTLGSDSVDCIVTSPPYYQLRDYGVDGQIGLENTVDEYIQNLIEVFRECKRILKSHGSLWIVISDTYNGDKKGITDRLSSELKDSKISKSIGRYRRKTLLAVPSRLEIAMIDDGWILRNEIIWHKPNMMPQSVKDRFSVDFEKILFFTKSEQYYFNQQKEQMITTNIHHLEKGTNTIRKLNRNPDIHPRGSMGVIGGGNSGRRKQDDQTTYPTDGMRNKRCVWKVPTVPSNISHYAMFPKSLIRPIIKAACQKSGLVMDPFCGAGTTGIVAKEEGCNFLGIELNPEYSAIASKRIEDTLVQEKLF